MPNWNKRVAEYVLPGHPDKLADAIADTIVAEATRRQFRALVGVEVALHRDVVFVDGRIACKGAETIDIEAIARSVYASAGYGEFEPHPDKLRVITDLDIGPLVDGEEAFRSLSDDQSIITGYACSTPGTDFLPVEHALVLRLGRRLYELRGDRPDLRLGPDGKLIVFVEETDPREGAGQPPERIGPQPERAGQQFRLTEVSVSIQHAADWDAVATRQAIGAALSDEIRTFAAGVPGFDASQEWELTINAVGDFVRGGPHGDNGLSGKKLVVDFYGPRVPIGGGAISGKDLHKVDRAGPILARRIAVDAVQRLGLRECTVTLAVRPGDTEFRVIRLEDEHGRVIDTGRIRIDDLSLAGVAQSIDVDRLVDSARFGHMTTQRTVPTISSCAS